MSLIRDLERARTEEDVKDAYIKALGLKSYFKGLVDIQTDEIWFEAKEASTAPLLMYAQLLVYVRAARKKGEPIPSFLCVIDREKAALMPSEKALPIFKDKSIKWPKSGSAADKELAAQIAPYVETHYVVYEIANHEKEFIKATKDAISEGRIIRTPITPDNLRQVFDKWMNMIGSELDGLKSADYATLFFADLMHDGENTAIMGLPARLLFDGGSPTFYLKPDIYKLASDRGYRNFWAIYHRPPEKKHRRYLLERRDSLLPLDERKFKGAYYTPLHIVDKAYDQLTATLGENWQKRYIVWDMCCGVGNLEVKHSNYRNVYMSTLDQEDIDNMRAANICAGATIFQYDYLNDDIDDFGGIDYTISNKVPKKLQQAIADAKAGRKGAKKILVLINPPYAEATSSENAKSGGEDRSKTGVARSKLASAGMEEYGKASNELFTQFLARAHIEIPRSVVAVFSKLKYLNAQALEQFRSVWQPEYLGGFVVESAVFEGLKGRFPIGFLIWNTAKVKAIESVITDVLDRDGAVVGEKKFVSTDGDLLLTRWVLRPSTNETPSIPLKGAIHPATTSADLRGTRWSDNAIGWFNCAGNDLQQAPGLTLILSSGFASGRGFFINVDNLSQVAMSFSVRRLIKKTWLNDRDQFLQPSKSPNEEFQSDCLVWMLFNGSNLSAGADGLEWNDQEWSLTNHFIPFTESEVGASESFESDFMVRYMEDLEFSTEAQVLLNAGRELWQRYHSISFPRKIIYEYKLNRADVGWYQIRKALNAYSDMEPVDFEPFESAYSQLSDKLRPMVYELGFLPE